MGGGEGGGGRWGVEEEEGGVMGGVGSVGSVGSVSMGFYLCFFIFLGGESLVPRVCISAGRSG